MDEENFFWSVPEDVPAEIQIDGEVTETYTGEQVADEAGNPAWWDDNYPGQTTTTADSPTQDAYGLNILNAAQTAQLTKNINPAFINSLVDPNTPTATTARNAVNTSAAAVDPTTLEGFGVQAPVDPRTLEGFGVQAPVDPTTLEGYGIQATVDPNTLEGFGVPGPIPVDTNQSGEGFGNIYPDGFGGFVNGNGQPVDANGLLIPTGTTNAKPVNPQDGQAYGNVFPDPNGNGGFVNANGDPVNPDGSPISAVPRSSTATAVNPADTGFTPAAGAGTAPFFGSNPDAEAEAASAAQVGRQLAQQQAVLAAQKRVVNNSDWRVRLQLAPGATYLYNAPQPGILWPLRQTDGVIFPYTPKIMLNYKADYEAQALTHSNYKGYFYKGSYADAVSLNATFTAQDTAEAEYLLAVIHFFRSVTKMFYGQDPNRGAPPPLVYLTGLGEYQFTQHPCAVANFNYSLPADIDYIRARSTNINGTNLLTRRNQQSLPTNPISGAVARLQNLFSSQGINKGALFYPPPVPNLGQNQPTYVPTKIEIDLTLYPMQSRQQVSKVFDNRQYNNGAQLKGGFW
jgi:hypothetical protein